MKKRGIVWLLIAVMLVCAVACGAKQTTVKDGAYTVAVTLEGGTGKAKIESPAALTVRDGKMTLTVRWSSDKYDYMLVGGEKLLPEYIDGHSVFTVPVDSLDKPLSAVADTTAMSTPHEIEYTITFDMASLAPAS